MEWDALAYAFKLLKNAGLQDKMMEIASMELTKAERGKIQEKVWKDYGKEPPVQGFLSISKGVLQFHEQVSAPPDEEADKLEEAEQEEAGEEVPELEESRPEESEDSGSEESESGQEEAGQEHDKQEEARYKSSSEIWESFLRARKSEFCARKLYDKQHVAALAAYRKAMDEEDLNSEAETEEDSLHQGEGTQRRWEALGSGTFGIY
ncbi:MAG: hypothetical protein Q9220_004159 [cf. Caloplaca sp. 1 TL-2023]